MSHTGHILNTLKLKMMYLTEVGKKAHEYNLTNIIDGESA